MKIRDDDVFFTVDVPILLLRIRPCTPAEAAARARRWTQSKNSLGANSLPAGRGLSRVSAICSKMTKKKSWHAKRSTQAG